MSTKSDGQCLQVSNASLSSFGTNSHLFFHLFSFLISILCFKLKTCSTRFLSDPVSTGGGGAEREPGGGIWEGTGQSQVEAEEAQRGGETDQEEGGRGWREEYSSTRLHQTVLWRDPAGTTGHTSLYIVCMFVCVCDTIERGVLDLSSWLKLLNNLLNRKKWWCKHAFQLLSVVWIFILKTDWVCPLKITQKCYIAKTYHSVYILASVCFLLF